VKWVTILLAELVSVSPW